MKTQDFHFEQPTPDKEQKTGAQIRTEFISKKFASKTDRQMLEEQVHLSQLRNEYTRSIKNYVQFFFWLTIVSLAVWLLISGGGDIQ